MFSGTVARTVLVLLKKIAFLEGTHRVYLKCLLHPKMFILNKHSLSLSSISKQKSLSHNLIFVKILESSSKPPGELTPNKVQYAEKEKKLL